ncbi:hypothetical protein GCM10025863_10810 [Microbacterium suwonense]|uniref:PurM-like N-terminal domain-containing protein n=1 Tax=Microbacterium suwonense TaxID=683047 RepID=A0ABM8FS32_9MICO|nr:hypothetical protein GCM10025863_10810 [Microbacterium suwonense]
MASDPDDPRIGDISEGAVLRAILARTAEASHTLLGPGDDAAVVAAPSASVVATTDTLVEGPDFRRAWSSGYDLGWKSAAVNLADIAAMGATPTALLVALAVPRDVRLSFVAAMADGFREACDALAPGCAVVGGDLTVSELMMIAVTALGDLGGHAAVTRSGASPGDVVALAGNSAPRPPGSRRCSGSSAMAAFRARSICGCWMRRRGWAWSGSCVRDRRSCWGRWRRMPVPPH